MKVFWFVGLVVALTMIMSASAFAMTGPLVGGATPALGGEIGYTELASADFSTVSSLHDETVGNPQNWYKGWWYVNLQNNTSSAWSSIKIKPGDGNLVAIVQGSGLVDEWGFVGNSVVSNKTGSIMYSTPYGSRTYDNAATGALWGQALFTFTTPLAVGQKVAFKIYTDNSYYEGPFASSFSMTLTPTAVPEPGTVAAALALLAPAGLMMRRRR